MKFRVKGMCINYHRINGKKLKWNDINCRHCNNENKINPKDYHHGILKWHEKFKLLNGKIR